MTVRTEALHQMDEPCCTTSISWKQFAPLNYFRLKKNISVTIDIPIHEKLFLPGKRQNEGRASCRA